MNARRCFCLLTILAVALLFGCADSEPGPVAAPEGTEYADTDIAPGPGSVTVALKMPEGYKINSAAPTKIVLKAGDAPVTFADGGNEIVLEKPTFPAETPVTFETGGGTLEIQYVVYYCNTGVPAQCYTGRGQVNVPVTVKDGAKETAVSAVLTVEPAAATGQPDLSGG